MVAPSVPATGAGAEGARVNVEGAAALPVGPVVPAALVPAIAGVALLSVAVLPDAGFVPLAVATLPEVGFGPGPFGAEPPPAEPLPVVVPSASFGPTGAGDVEPRLPPLWVPPFRPPPDSP